MPAPQSKPQLKKIMSTERAALKQAIVNRDAAKDHRLATQQSIMRAREQLRAAEQHHAEKVHLLEEAKASLITSVLAISEGGKALATARLEDLQRDISSAVDQIDAAKGAIVILESRLDDGAVQRAEAEVKGRASAVIASECGHIVAKAEELHLELMASQLALLFIKEAALAAHEMAKLDAIRSHDDTAEGARAATSIPRPDVIAKIDRVLSSRADGVENWRMDPSVQRFNMWFAQLQTDPEAELS